MPERLESRWLTVAVADKTDVQHLVKQLMAGATPEEGKALLDALMNGQVTSIFEKLKRDERPALLPVPERVRGFRVRLDLHGAKPPIWRRLELPGDLTLPQVHVAIQAAMGWYDSHLHRFRMSNDHRSAYFATEFDLDEGDEGMPEADVRLDQLLAEKGDELWYEYDFGDGWDHKLVVEAVLDDPPATVRCTAGRMACPPEDCGGMWGYAELAAWVRGGCDSTSVPSPFDTADDARDWLPLEWHPDRFDVAETSAAIAAAMLAPVPVPDELAALRTRLEHRGDPTLTHLLERAATHPVVEVDESAAARLLEPYLELLDVIGDGVHLTAAGYLPPAVVEPLADRTGVTGWWIGSANREDLTRPLARLRASARALGLIGVRKGRLTPTALARRSRHQPVALWQHIVSRLPIGRTDFDRQAGWAALAVVASGTPADEWNNEIRALLLGLGWRVADRPSFATIAVDSPTLEVLEFLAGRARSGRVTGLHPAVAATARAAIDL